MSTSSVRPERWIVCLTLTLSSTALAGPAPGLQCVPATLVRGAGTERVLSSGEGVVRARNVAVDETTLSQLRTGELRRVRLAFFDDAVFDARFERVRSTADGGVSGAGHVDGIMGALTAFAARGDRFSAFVRVPGRGAFVVEQRDGRFVARELAEPGATRAGCAVTGELLARQHDAIRGVPPCPFSISTLAGYSADDGATVDVMVVYTEAARDQAGDDATIQLRIDMSAAATNQILSDSLVPMQIEVIRKALITYTESTSAITDLNRLVEPADGQLDFIHAERDTYGADLVQMWVENIETGGVAYQLFELGSDDDGRFTFSVMRQDNWPLETMAHEFGHNFGCQHDRDNLSGVGFFVYSYGYREPGDVWKTVMAYPPGTTIPYFSNPNLTYTGPLGNHGPMGVGGVDPNTASDCARTISETAWTVANFRPSTLTAVPPSRVYVSASASPGGDGTSWATAFQDMQEGVSQAVQARGAVTEVWVAAGVYKPDRGRTDPLTVRKMSIRLVEGVTIYGGFAGGETMLSQRDIVANPTILDGDIGVAADASDNSYHVVDGTDVDGTAVLDGFTIRNGNANAAYPHDIGGGMRNVCGSPTIRNCTFTSNHAVFSGGGVGNRFDSAPTFENCTFGFNSADAGGGGMFIEESQATLVNCEFNFNSAPNHAAVDVTFLSDPDMTGCTFTNNAADWGGAVGFYNATGTMTSCTFSNNAANNGGGALITGFNSTPVLNDCGFDSNTAGFGGAWYAYDGGNASLALCTFTDNIADDGAAAYLAASAPTLDDCAFVQNHAGGGGFGSGGAVVIRDPGGDPLLTDCTFDGNTAGCCGGAVTAWLDALPVFEDTLFVGNSSNFGGAVWYASGADGSHVNCRFLANTGDFGGGAVHVTDVTSPQFVNCAFSGNTAPSGSGGVFLNYSNTSASITNCTLTGNSAAFDSGAIWNDACTMTVDNGILWQNTDANGTVESSQISNFNGATVAVNHSIVQGWTGGLGGVGNFSTDPRFVNADGADNVPGSLDDDVRLEPDSPAIDSGDNAAVPAGVTTDLDGNPRFEDLACIADTGMGSPPIVDRGAYEISPSGVIDGDFDCDGDVDTGDFAVFGQCFGGSNLPPAAGCPDGVDADFDDDNDVDTGDFATFAQNFTGSN